jgi:drug/metabolite transporter (DMT)-like permease
MYNRKKGITMMLLSALLFSVMNVFSRFAGEMPLVQRTFFRCLATAFMIYLLMRRKGISIRPRKGSLVYHILRSGFGIAAILGNVYAVDHMALSDATMIMELNPFFAILASVFILGERPKAKQLICVAVALVGAAFVVKPSAALFSNGGAVLVALCSAVLGGFAYTYVRKLTQGGENGLTVIFFFSVFSCFVCAPSLVLDPVAPSLFVVLMLVGIAVTGCLAQLCITAAYSYAPAAEISFYDYSQLIFAAIFGWVFFRQVADGWSYLGYAIIVAAALAMFLDRKK